MRFWQTDLGTVLGLGVSPSSGHGAKEGASSKGGDTWWSIEELGGGASVVRSKFGEAGPEKEVWVLQVGGGDDDGGDGGDGECGRLSELFDPFHGWDCGLNPDVGVGRMAGISLHRNSIERSRVSRPHYHRQQGRLASFRVQCRPRIPISSDSTDPLSTT